MKKQIPTLIALLFFFQSFSQDFWYKADVAEANRSGQKSRVSIPEKQALYRFDANAFKLALAAAPMRGSAVSNLILPFPDSNGQLQHFRIYEAPVMHPALAAKFPGNKSYVGQGIENRSSIIRFSVTLFGLHAMALAANDGTFYIDPYSNDGNYYTVYARKGLTTPNRFECHTAMENRFQSADDFIQPQDNGLYRTYRTGIVTTAEYSAFHIAQAGLESGTLEEKKAAVLAAVTITITRVNSMFERDLSVFLQLIPNEDAVIFIDTDDLTNDDVGALINETQETLDTVIGTENYDFGHGVGTSGGGLGGGQPCSEGGKAFGATGLGSPVGDPFDIDYVAHEMGHQFGAAHTFNNSCDGNRDTNWSYEPGSGSSIMAYAGICDPNIQGNSNAQFFAGSITQIRNTINGGGGSCAAVTLTGNNIPVPNAGTDYTIPKGTAFVLTGTATDIDNDALTYMWEQYDREISEQPPVATATEGPNFKPQVITDVPIRYLPQLSDVLANNLVPTWEVIANVGREYNFAFTVRDNNLNGGESATDYMRVTASNEAGPFVITSPNTTVDWTAASNQTVTWDVAGTTGNGVNTAFVDILLSTDGGLHFNTTLAENVPNDGSQIITVPNTPGVLNRILVRGHGNIFYDVSNQNFTISAAPSTFLLDVAGSQNISACKGTAVSFLFAYTTINGFSDNTTFSVNGLPDSAVAAFSPTYVSGNDIVTLSLTNTAASPVGFYTITVTGTSGSITKTTIVYLDLLSPDFATITLTAPENMAVGTNLSTTLQWSADSNASAYDIEIATDSAFSNIINTATVGTNSYTVSGLLEATVYYWRIKSKNAGCEGIFGNFSQFTTGISVCADFSSVNIPVVIPADTAGTVTSTLDITDVFNIQKATITLNLSHTWVTDLTVKLISPAGTEIQLFRNQCGDADNVAATFSDGGSQLSCNGNPVISGIIAPDTPLSTLNSESSNGTWTLEVYDEFGEDGGFINSWNLNLCSIQPALSVPEYATDLDFALYPNPNTGNFTLKLDAEDSGDYRINVYDMRGRKIFEKKSVVNGGSLHEHIDLHAEAGVYLIEVQNKGRKNTKKFIIR